MEVQRLGRYVVEVGSKVGFWDGMFVADNETRAVELSAKYM